MWFTGWNKDSIDRLRRLAANGLTSAEIARELGDDVSRNMVIGKAWRMKIPLLVRDRAVNRAISLGKKRKYKNG